MAPRDRPGQRLGFATAPSEEQAALLEGTKVMRETPLNIFRTLVRHPKLYRRSMALGAEFMFGGRIDPRDREIVILRVAYRTRSVYEYGQHVVIGATAGLAPEEIADLAMERPSVETFSDAELALVAMADDLCDDDCVTDATWAALGVDRSDEEVMELLFLAGYYRMLAGFLNSAGVPLDPDIPGWPDT